MLDHLRDQLGRELRAVTDSPVFLARRRPTSPRASTQPATSTPVGQLLLDAVALAFTQVVNLLEKRLHRLLDARFSGAARSTHARPGRQSGVVILHKQVIGLVAQARTLAAPAGIHALDASTGQEDFRPTRCWRPQLDDVLAALELALAHELVALRQARFLAGAPLPAPLERPVSWARSCRR